MYDAAALLIEDIEKVVNRQDKNRKEWGNNFMAGSYKNTEHAFKIFNRDLKNGNFPPVILMHGTEDYLIRWAVKSLVKKYVNPAAKSLDFVKLNEEGTSCDMILEACNTFSMFSEKKVVWVKDFPPLVSAAARGYTSVAVEEIIEYLNSPSDGCILIFSSEKLDAKSNLVKALRKAGKVYDFNKLDYAQLAAFAEKRFRNAGVSINRDILRYLIDETGYFNKETEYRISNLNNDILKIIAHCDDGVVTENDVIQTLKGDLDTFAFNFLDSISSRNKDSAFELLHNILSAGTDVYSIIGLLVSQFELLLAVKEFKEDGMRQSEIAAVAKVHEFRIKKAMGFADRFTIGKLKDILCQLYETDRNIKTGTLEQTLALELLVGRM